MFSVVLKIEPLIINVEVCKDWTPFYESSGLCTKHNDSAFYDTNDEQILVDISHSVN